MPLVAETVTLECECHASKALTFLHLCTPSAQNLAPYVTVELNGVVRVTNMRNYMCALRGPPALFWEKQTL